MSRDDDAQLELWRRYRQYLWTAPDLGLSLDVSRVRFDDHMLVRERARLEAAIAAMDNLEAGALANADEQRMVGHYWLRAPLRAPTTALHDAIEQTVTRLRAFAAAVHAGEVRGADGRFEHAIHIGIGGSALGPQLMCDALGGVHPPVRVHFLDNADPDGVARLLAELEGQLGRTLVSVVSKSGFTPTPRHVTSLVESAYARSGLRFARHAVATTMEGTSLDVAARDERWLARFPIWEWVGGRTSITSAVGLLPGALEGIDTGQFLAGAAAMDELTRERAPQENPALLLASMWHWLGDGRGARRMVVLPYRDRLALLPRYVQQLMMESIGKARDRRGTIVHQGFTVYGHKGATDQHAYLQQLRDGTPDFFITFVGVSADQSADATEIAPALTLGDYLFGSLEGTRDAIYERGRDSITIVLDELSARSLGALVALYERSVGLYAELVDVNAYHQPGVDKHAAESVVALQREVEGYLSGLGREADAEEIAAAIARPECVETIDKLLRRRCLTRAPKVRGAG